MRRFDRIIKGVFTGRRPTAAAALLTISFLALTNIGCERSTPLPTDVSTETGSDEIGEVDENGRKVVNAQGRLLPTQGLASIVGLPSDRIDTISAQEGYWVTPDDFLGKLSSHSLRMHERNVLTARLGESGVTPAPSSQVRTDDEAEADYPESQSASELDAKKSQLDLLEKLHETAMEQHRRVEDLWRESDVVSDQQFETSKLRQYQARAEWQAARIQYDSLRRQRDAQLRLVDAQLERSELRSPIEGHVVKVYAKKGEVVGNRPIIQVANLNDMTCIAEVYESDVAKIRKGDKVTVTSSAFEATLKGSVTSIGRIITAPELKKLNPLARVDGRIVQVEIQLKSPCCKTRETPPDEPRPTRMTELINLQVNVRIVLGSDDS